MSKKNTKLKPVEEEEQVEINIENEEDEENEDSSDVEINLESEVEDNSEPDVEIEEEGEEEELEFAEDIVDETLDEEFESVPQEELEIVKPKKREYSKKRLLTEEEKEDIMDFLRVETTNNWETVIATIGNVKRDLLHQFENVQVYPEQIPKIKEIVKKCYHKSKMSPGQMVGCDSALGIGEVSTQLTLNSVDYEELVMIKNDESVIVTKIGEYIDNIVKTCSKDKLTLYKENNTEYVDTINESLEIPCVDENGKMWWKKIEAVTRHPPPNLNGDFRLLHVKTKSGRSVRATASKSFLLRKDNKIVGVNGSELKIGDRLPVTIQFPEINESLTSISLLHDYRNIDLDYDFGLLLGKYLSGQSHSLFDSWIKKYDIQDEVMNNLFSKCEKNGRNVPEFSFISNKDFLRGIINGYFNNIQCFVDNRMIMYKINSEILLDSMNCILNIFGIFSHKTIDNNICILSIGDCNIKTFLREFTFNSQNHAKKVEYLLERFVIYKYGFNDIIPGINTTLVKGNIHRDNILEELIRLSGNADDYNNIKNAINSEVFFDEIVSIEKVKSTTPYVYDFTIADTRNFSLFNGLAMNDTFHASGTTVAAVLTGVPRFNEVLNASKKQKTNTLTMKLKEPFKSLSETRDKCRVLFEEKYISDLIEVGVTKEEDKEYKHLYLGEKKDKVFCDYINNIEPYRYNNLNEEDQKWYKFYDTFYSNSYQKCKYSIRLRFNKYLLYQYKLEISSIARKIESEYGDCKCVFSPTSIGIIDVYVDTTNIESPDVIIASRKKTRKKKKKTDEDDDNLIADQMFITDKNKDFYFVRDVASDFVMSIKINGVDGIEKIFYVQDKKTEEWEVQTSGTNMRDIMNHHAVNFKSVISNNMWEIFETLGIEAARKFIINETISIIGSGIDISHPELLGDAMTRSGTIRAVNRYGIGKEESGPLSMASFEQSHENMTKSAARGEEENCSTVSAAIIVGKNARIGSGYPDLMMNTKMLKNSKIYNNVSEEDFNENFDEEKLNAKLDTMMGLNKKVEEPVTRKPSLYKQSLEKGVNEKNERNDRNKPSKGTGVFKQDVVIENYDPEYTEF